jgi:hypothetical protein
MCRPREHVERPETAGKIGAASCPGLGRPMPIGGTGGGEDARVQAMIFSYSCTIPCVAAFGWGLPT